MKKRLWIPILFWIMMFCVPVMAEDESAGIFCMDGYTGVGGDVAVMNTIQGCQAEIIEIAAFGSMDTRTSPAFPEEIVGAWNAVKAVAEGMEMKLADYGMSIQIKINADGTALFSDGEDVETVSWTFENGSISMDNMTLSLTSDGMLCVEEEGDRILFERTEEENLELLRELPAAAPEGEKESDLAENEIVETLADSTKMTVSNEQTEAMVDLGSYLERKYICKSLDTNGEIRDAAVLGTEYSVIFHENGQTDFVLAGTAIPELRWTQEKVQTETGKADAFSIVYLDGTALNFVITETGLELDYYGSVTVWEKAASDQNLAAHRQTAANTGSICGVLFLGYVYGGVGDNIADDSAYRQYVLDSSGCADEFTFLEDIPTDRIVEIDGGKEVFCIYPCDENASVTVREFIRNEANDYSGETGAVLYHSETGEPILLRCNVSEGISDSQVTITDSQGETLVWEPAISLYDGTISVPRYAPFIYNATYDALEDYGQDRYFENRYEDEDLYEDGRSINLDGTRYIMQVINCEEWVSLRELPDVNSARLDKIPLGAYLYDCQWYSDDFVYGNYNGQYGYVLSEYLTLVDAVLDYVDDDYEDYERNWGEVEKPHGYFNYTPLPYDSITEEDGIEIINRSIKGYTILASRFYDWGEVMRVGCYVNGTEPLWGYVTSVGQITESAATDAFLAGTSDDPKVVIYNSAEGLYMLDLKTGEVLWNRTSEELELSGSICYAVDENGTMYLAGYQGTDILAVTMDGSILWRTNAQNSDIYWPYQISVIDDVIIVDYESGTEEGHYVVAYNLDGSPKWMDILWTLE